MPRLIFIRCGLICSLLGLSALAQPALPEPDARLKLLPGTTPLPGFKADLADLAWLAGNWRTQSKAGFRDDTWLAAEGRQMSGINRAIVSDRVAYMNLMVMRQEGDVVTMHHKNFGAALNERGTRDFTLLNRDGAYYYFTGLTLHRINDDFYEALYDFGTETQLQLTRRVTGRAPTVAALELTTEKELYPEGLAVDPAGARIWLNSTNQNKIVQAGFAGTGTIDLQTPYRGKLRGTGLLFQANLLFALGNDNYDDTPGAPHKSVLQLIDPVSGTLLRAFEHTTQQRTMFNDVTVDDMGIAYISNTSEGAIYRVDTRNPNGQLDRLIQDPDLEGANGLCLSTRNDRLFIASETGIRILLLPARSILPFQDKSTVGIDGLKYHRGSLYGIQRGQLVRYHLSATEDAITHSSILIAKHPLFDAPTSLCAMGDSVYVLANSQFGKRQRIEQGLADRAQLTNTFVLRYPLGAAD